MVGNGDKRFDDLKERVVSCETTSKSNSLQLGVLSKDVSNIERRLSKVEKLLYFIAVIVIAQHGWSYIDHKTLNNIHSPNVISSVLK